VTRANSDHESISAVSRSKATASNLLAALRVAGRRSLCGVNQ
jgi:hypothetical protein